MFLSPHPASKAAKICPQVRIRNLKKQLTISHSKDPSVPGKPGQLVKHTGIKTGPRTSRDKCPLLPSSSTSGMVDRLKYKILISEKQKDAQEQNRQLGLLLGMRAWAQGWRGRGKTH